MSAYNERLDAMCNNLEENIRPKLTLPLPSKEIIRLALAEMLNTRTAKRLANAPPMNKRPLASLLHRLVTWHGSGGNLSGVFSITMDCGVLTRFKEKPESFNVYWQTDGIKEAAALLPEGITEKELFEQMDTLALSLTGGKSRAAEAWGRVL